MTPAKNGSEVKMIGKDIAYIKDDIRDIKQELKDNLVTKDQFTAVTARVALLERAVYGFVAIVCITVIGALLALVVR